MDGIEITGREKRQPPRKDGEQNITRIPPWRPGRWVKLKPEAPGGLGGKVRGVQSLTCALDPAGRAIWRVHFPDGRCVRVEFIERFATETEVRRAEQGKE